MIGGDGEAIIVQEGRFIVSPEAEIPHPMANAKGFRHSDRFLYAYMLASQYDKLGNPVKAEARFTEGYNMRPEYQRGIVDFARFHLKAGNFKQSLALVERLGKRSHSGSSTT